MAGPNTSESLVHRGSEIVIIEGFPPAIPDTHSLCRVCTYYQTDSSSAFSEGVRHAGAAMHAHASVPSGLVGSLPSIRVAVKIILNHAPPCDDLPVHDDCKPATSAAKINSRGQD